MSGKQNYHHGDLRKALLDAGEMELAEKGIEGFTLRGCAKRAGVSHAAPAHHFKDINGLLTALAAEGFDRFVAAMRARQARAADSPREKLIAAGLGYIDFATANKALFQLMFSSNRPDFRHDSLQHASKPAFKLLIDGVASVAGADPARDVEAMRDVAAAWAIAHGLADLLLSGQLDFLGKESSADPDATYAAIIGRAIPE